MCRGCHGRRGRSIGCRASRSGSIRRVRVRSLRTVGATRSAGIGRIATVAGAGGTMTGQRPWGRLPPIRGDCTTCTGTYGSGWRTAGTARTVVRLSDGSAWERRGTAPKRVLRGGSWYSFPGGLRSAFRFRNRPRESASATSADSAWPGRSPPESLRPYLLRGVPRGGWPPWVDPDLQAPNPLLHILPGNASIALAQTPPARLTTSRPSAEVVRSTT